MSVPGFGQVTRLQGTMISLSGEVPTMSMVVTDEMRISAMINARRALVTRTNVDFEYDLKKWHEFLCNDSRFAMEYQFPRAWENVIAVVKSRIGDPERERLLKTVRESNSNSPEETMS